MLKIKQLKKNRTIKHILSIIVYVKIYSYKNGGMVSSVPQLAYDNKEYIPACSLQ